MAGEGQRQIQIKVPGYEGPDRRLSELVVGPCDCHTKHTRVLSDHEKRLDQNHDDHGLIWEDVKKVERAKLDKKTFFWLIGIFVTVVLVSVGGSYRGMAKMNAALFEKVTEVDKKVAVMNAGLEFHMDKAEEIEGKIKEVHDDLEDHIKQTNGGKNHQHQ